MTTALSFDGAVPEFDLADRARKAREYAGLMQIELAQRTGVTRNTVARIEQGKTRPRRPTLLAIAMATGVDSTWLETGKTPAGEPGGGSECAIRESNPEPTD